LSDENKKFYFDAVDDSDIDETLQQCVTHGDGKVIIWKEYQDKNKAETYQIESYDKHNKRLYFRADSFLKSFKVSSNLGNKVYFRLTTGRFYFFSTSTLDFDSDNGLYSMAIRDVIHRGQQRGDFRLKSSEKVSIIAVINKQEYPCRDISSSGLCCEVPDAQASFFEVGKIFFKMEVVFNGAKYKIHQVTIKSATTAGKNKTAIGIKFSEIDERTEEQLFRQINIVAKEEDDRIKRSGDRT